MSTPNPIVIKFYLDHGTKSLHFSIYHKRIRHASTENSKLSTLRILLRLQVCSVPDIISPNFFSAVLDASANQLDALKLFKQHLGRNKDQNLCESISEELVVNRFPQENPHNFVKLDDGWKKPLLKTTFIDGLLPWLPFVSILGRQIVGSLLGFPQMDGLQRFHCHFHELYCICFLRFFFSGFYAIVTLQSIVAIVNLVFVFWCQ